MAINSLSKSTLGQAGAEASVSRTPKGWLSGLGTLHSLLVAAGFNVAPDRWLNATDLLSQLIASGDLPQRPEAIAEVLSPLFCGSRAEQEAFGPIVEQWWSRINETGLKAEVQAEPQADLLLKPQAEAASANRQSATVSALRKTTRVSAPLAVTVVVAAVVSGIWLWHKSQEPELPTPTPATATNKKTITPAAATGQSQNQDQDIQALNIAIQPVPPRTPVEHNIPPLPLPLSQADKFLLQAAQWLAFLCWPLMLLAILMLGAWQRTELKRKKLDQNTPVTDLTLGATVDDLFDGPNVRKALRQLHRPITLPSRHLDIQKTVAATLDQAGLFTPVQGKRQWVPSVMLWVNVKGGSDPLLGMAHTLALRLKQTHLDTELYRFQGQPNYLRPEAITAKPKAGDSQWLNRQQVLALNPNSRIIILGRGEGLIDLWSEQPLPWLASLHHDNDVLLLEADGAASRSSQALREAGILLAPLTSNGLEEATQWAAQLWAANSEHGQEPQLTANKKTKTFSSTTYALPSGLQDSDRLTQPVAPKKGVVIKLIEDLKTYLGSDGFLLLVAAAVYPEFRWSLVRILDLSLAENEPDYSKAPDSSKTSDSSKAPDYSPQYAKTPAAQERRLLNLAQLPWAREGWLPEWLREQLLRQTSSQQRKSLQLLYQKLLQRGATDSANTAQLPVYYRDFYRDKHSHAHTRENKTLLAAVRHWINQAKPGSALTDAVFADFMWGGWPSRLRFTLPANLAKLIPQPRQLWRSPVQWRAWVLAAALSSAAGFAWQHLGHPQLFKALAGIKPDEQPVFANYRLPDSELALALEQTTDAVLLADSVPGPSFWAAFMGLETIAARTVEVDNQGGSIDWLDEHKDKPFDQLETILLNNQSPIQQMAAAFALARRQDEDGLPILAELLASDSDFLTEAALVAIGSYGPKAQELLPEVETLAETLLGSELEEVARRTQFAITENGQLDNTSQTPVVVYQPQWQDAALWLSDRIAYLRYNQPAQLIAAQGEFSLLLNGNPLMVWQPPISVQGNAFRDTLNQEFNREQWLSGFENRQAQQTSAEAQKTTQQTTPQTPQQTQAPAANTQEVITFTETLNLRDGPKAPTMVVIPAGRFTMGSPSSEVGRNDDEGPQRDVTIARFAMSEAEVTFAQYDRFARDTGRDLPADESWGRGQRPVINVSWQDATAYAQWLSEHTGQDYRLPTEAEWEYAARASTNTNTPFNTGECLTAEQANIRSTQSFGNCPAGDTYLGQTVLVKSYAPNAFGLYDMHGNVWEWTQDCWHESYRGAPIDGRAWLDGNSGDCNRRVVRGGSWGNFPRNARSAYRDRYSTGVANGNIGFRLARTLNDNEFNKASRE